jgi:hypothetical protein
LKQESPDYVFIADSVFQNLLTIVTILSGSYSAIALGKFAEALGQATTTQLMTQATFGIVYGLIFLVPLIIIILGWALSKFRNSLTWKTFAWSGLIYCLTQDLLGVIAMLGLALVGIGILDDNIVVLGMPIIFFVPPGLGSALGYRICKSYYGARNIGRNRLVLTALGSVAILTFIHFNWFDHIHIWNTKYPQTLSLKK